MTIDEKKFYLTKNGLIKIQKEYQELKKIKILKIKEKSSCYLHIRADDSEDSCFLEDMNFLEAKVTELKKVLENTALIKKPPEKEQNKINLGATVVLQGEDGRISKFVIVGTLEASPEAGKISFCSPLGKALLGHKVNDQVVVVSLRSMIYKIIKITYHN